MVRRVARCLTGSSLSGTRIGSLGHPPVILLLAVAVSILIGACAPAAAPASPATAPGDGRATSGSERKEVTLVKSVRPILASTVAALEKGNIAAATKAWAPYNGTWNGVEVYINFRSMPIYEDLEHNYEAKIAEALEGPKPDAAKILPLAKAMLAKYDEAIQLAQTGPAISPLFDDVADIRIARAPLRGVAPSLKSGNIVAAKASFGAFTEAWPGVSNLIKLRSAGAYQEIEQAIAQVDTAWQKPQPSAEDLTPLVANLTNRYNYGLNLLNTAARKADLTKATYSDEDVQAAAGIRKIQAELKNSLTQWSAGNYQAAAGLAGRASGELFATPAVSAPLKAIALDATLKTALDSYKAVAAAPGDAAKVKTANKDAMEAGEIVLQGLVGQFWTDPKLAEAIESASQG